MPICACECDEQTKGGIFCPGHDSKLRTKIESKIGGLLNLEKLVDAAMEYAEGRSSLDEYGRITKLFFVKG